MSPERHRRMQVPPNSDLTLGMVCVDKAVPGRCTWRMRADERFANPAGIMQGGFLGAFADSAMGAAAVTFVEGRKVFASNAEMKISFLAPVAVGAGAVLECTAEVVSGGSRVAFVEAGIRLVTGSEVGGEGEGGGEERAGAGRPGSPPPEGAAEGPAGHPVGEAGRLVARASSTYVFTPRD